MQKRNCWCLEIILFGIFLIIIFSFSVSGIRINEVMYAPNHTEAYNEYVEIYNDETTEINLNSWKLCDNEILSGYVNRSGKINLNTTLILLPNSYALITDGGSSGTEVYSNFNVSNNFIALHINGAAMCNNGLNNTGENISITNSTGGIIYSFFYSSSFGANGNGKSLQFCNGGWIEAEPTPGTENLCQQQNQTLQNQTQNSTQNQPKIYLELEYDEEIENSDEIRIEVKAFNLNGSYDIKVFLTDDNEKIISETYNNIEEKWKSSNYYVNEIFNGSGNKSTNLKLRIDEEYKNFEGEAKINIRIRKTNSSSFITEFSDNIKILKREASNSINMTQEGTNIQSNKENNENTSIIKLNNPKDIKTREVYKSKIQYIKDYAIYGFALFCILIIILLIIKKLK